MTGVSRAGLRRAEVPGAFDVGAAAYDRLVGANPGYHDHLRISARRMRIPDGGRGLRLLDAGCGTGASTAALLEAAQHAQIYTQTRDLLRRALAAAEAANDALATTTLRPHPSPRDIPTQPSPASLSGPKPSTAARPPPPSPCPRGRTTPPVPVHGSQTTKTLDADDEDAAWAHPAASLLRVVESHVTARGRELDVTLSSLVETFGRLVTARITAARMSARLEAESA